MAVATQTNRRMRPPTSPGLLDRGVLLVKDGRCFSGNYGRVVTADWSPLKRKFLNELALALSLLFAGLVLLPLAIYLTGQAVFGEYGGTGFADFYGRLSAEVREGSPVVWFLVLSPYLILMLLRLTIWAFQKSRRAGSG